MLNKLLKRCMPWMDKGRWYHVEYELDSNQQLTYIKYDNIFISHELITGEYSDLILHVDPDRQKMIIKDYKYMASLSDEERYILDPTYNSIMPRYFFDENSDDIIDAAIAFPVTINSHIEFWLYITEA